MINEHKAAEVRLIFSMHGRGQGCGQIIDEPNHGGLHTKRGEVFGKNSICEILRNEGYAGIYVFNRAVSGIGGNATATATRTATRLSGYGRHPDHCRPGT